MKKLNYHIEQADNGIVIGDRTDCTEDEPSMILEVAYDKDIAYTLGRMLWGEINALMDEKVANAVNLYITLEPTKFRI